MLISNKIRELSKQRRFSLNKLAKAINMSGTGFYQMLDKEDLRISTLEKISNVLGVDMRYWFSDMAKPNTIANESIFQYGNKNNAIINNIDDCKKELEKSERKIEYLQKEIILKDKIIELLEKNENNGKM